MCDYKQKVSGGRKAAKVGVLLSPDRTCSSRKAICRNIRDGDTLITKQTWLHH